MYSSTQLAFRYLGYRLRASNGKGHGIHSPFVYEFVEQVLNDDRSFYPYKAIESRRTELERDQRLIPVEDFGKTPVHFSKQRVSAIASLALSSRKFGRLLFRVVNHYQPAHIIELGSSLGISAAYLSAASPRVSLTTLEGSPAIAEIAAETFRKLGLENIRQRTGNFDEQLEKVLADDPPAGLVYIDGNHRKEPLLNYFHQFLKKKQGQSVFILHDIHWSREMEEAWKIIRNHPEVMLTIDLFSAGFVFFRDSFHVNQHFTIRF